MIKWIIGAVLLVAVLVFGISFYLQPNDFIGCGDTPQDGSTKCVTADAIVVVSGGDTNARTDEGIKLFEHGWADSIVFSGAAQDKSGPSNAAAMRQRALAAGVPATAIFVDEQAATTEQNAMNTKTIFKDNDFKTVILVTSGYHQRRAELEFRKESAGSVTILDHPLLQDKDWSFWWFVTPRGWWLASGEIAKIIVFYVQGIKL